MNNISQKLVINLITKEVATECVVYKIVLHDYDSDRNHVEKIFVTADYWNYGSNIAYKIKNAVERALAEIGINYGSIYLDL